MVVMDVFTRRIIGFGVAPADLEGPAVCRMFNRAIARQKAPKYLSSDNDPLFRFHRWRANLRVLEVNEVKAIPCAPRSHGGCAVMVEEGLRSAAHGGAGAAIKHDG